MTDFKELKAKPKEDLKQFLKTETLELAKLRLTAHTKQLKNIRQIRYVRKTIAQILTLINKGV